MDLDTNADIVVVFRDEREWRNVDARLNSYDHAFSQPFIAINIT